VLIGDLNIFGHKSIYLIERTIGIPRIDISRRKDILQTMLSQCLIKSCRRIGQIHIEKLLFGQVTKIVDSILQKSDTVFVEKIFYFFDVQFFFVSTSLFSDKIDRGI
jgi:hypothetical protein